MWKRFVSYADKHAWIVTLTGVAIMFVVVACSVTWNQRRETRQTRDQINIVTQQNIAITNAFVRGCKLAVGNSQEVNLAVLDYIKQRQIDNGRPPTKALTDLENIVLQKQNPDTTCVPPPKENP